MQRSACGDVWATAGRQPLQASSDASVLGHERPFQDLVVLVVADLAEVSVLDEVLLMDADRAVAKQLDGLCSEGEWRLLAEDLPFTPFEGIEDGGSDRTRPCTP